MTQFFSKPDLYLARCGDLRCALSAVEIPGAPAFMRGLRAVFVTDVHVTPRTTDGQIEALAGKIMAGRPDIVLLGGDYSDDARGTRRFFEGVGRVTAPLGCFGAVGNNDREAFADLRELRRIMSGVGFELLVNEARTVRVHGGRLTVAGLDEYRYGKPDVSGLYPDASAPNLYRLLISHFPKVVSPMPDLMVSGHTHGGQFNLLGITPYTVGFERLIRPDRASRYIEGLHSCRGCEMLVSKGIGASRIPLRVGVRPEIHLLTF